MNILPDPARAGEIKFIFAKNLPYNTRLLLILVLLSAGLLFQIFISFWLGFFLVAAAIFLSLIHGYADKPVLTGPEKWGQVTPDEYEKVKIKQDEHRRWDRDFFDITNPQGAVSLIVIAMVCFVTWFCLVNSGQKRLALYWMADCLVVFLPHWFTGIKSFLTKDKLIIKIGLLKKAMELLSSPSDIQVLPMMSTRQTKDKGTLPMDARLMVRFINAPKYFLGMQIQISINSVEGKDYPYLYCVLIADDKEKVFKKNWEDIWRQDYRLTIEETRSEDVGVLVIRQRTTTNSGYYTNWKASKFIIETSLDIARRLLQSRDRAS